MISIGMPIAATGEISLDNDDSPKLLVRQIMMLSKSFVAHEKTEEKPNVGGTTAQAASVMPAVKTSEETNYRCRLEGNELKFL